MNLIILLVGTVLASAAARRGTNSSIRTGAAVLLFAMMLAAPFLSDSPGVLFDALTAMCIAYGWNFIGGYTGYASFGNVAFLGLGAFVAAAFMSRQPGHLAWPWFVGIPLSVIIVSIVAGLLGLVVLRLRGHYFSIATLGIAVAMPEFIQWDLLFGTNGPLPRFFGGGLPLNFPLASDVTLFGIDFSSDRYVFYFFGLATALIGWLLTVLISRSKFGYGLVAIRENEEAAEVMGVNTWVAKVAAYMLSAALAALGGAVIGYRLTNMTTEAEALFSTANNLQMIIICLLGGTGTVWGPWIGAFLLFAIQEAIRGAGGGNFLQWEATAFSFMIVLVVLFLPRGVMQFLRGQTDLTPRVFLRNLVAYRV